MNHRDLDRHITGNGGEDQYPEKEPCMSVEDVLDEALFMNAFGYSPMLAKACFDSPFDYAMCLTDGTVWRVSGVKAINKDFVHVSKARFVEVDFNDKHKPPAYPFERGVDVRVDCIMWIADAPEGS